ncbi:MAG: inner membrane CreD family protein [Archangium sp.]|nr:inner membrane CreD family protein [Archangium sp.]
MKRIAWVLLVVGVVVMALHIVDGLREERSSRRYEAARTIADTNGGDLELYPPLLTVRVEERYPSTEQRRREVVRQGHVVNEDYTVPVERSETRTWLLIPETLHATSSHAVETRFLGIMPGRVQNAQVQLQGAFRPSAQLWEPHHTGGVTTLTSVSVSLGFGSVRTLEQIVSAQLDSAALRFETAGHGLNDSDTVAAQVPASTLEAGREVPFDMSLALRGGASFMIHPLAERSDITLDAAWPHPDFTHRGRSNTLPTRRTITDTSSHAEWLITGLSSGLQSVTDIGSSSEAMQQPSWRAGVGVEFVDPVDVFARVERSLKYGLPLIALSLALLWFLLKRADVATHVMHFLLLAMSLVVFFLLLLSLTEKVDFAVAYGISAGAVSLLNVTYLSGLLKKWRSAVTAWAPTAACFGALYGLLVSEDSALLLGSAFVFTLLASFMLLTRRVDWNQALRSRALQP